MGACVTGVDVAVTGIGACKRQRNNIRTRHIISYCSRHMQATMVDMLNNSACIVAILVTFGKALMT